VYVSTEILGSPLTMCPVMCCDYSGNPLEGWSLEYKTVPRGASKVYGVHWPVFAADSLTLMLFWNYRMFLSRSYEDWDAIFRTLRHLQHARFLMKGRAMMQTVQPTLTLDTSTPERLSASWVRTRSLLPWFGCVTLLSLSRVLRSGW
jgi:hypothetical protein